MAIYLIVNIIFNLGETFDQNDFAFEAFDHEEYEIVIQTFCCVSAIQQAFDDDVRSGSINKDGWLSNSTSEGRLGYKLIVQTGSPSVPIDKRRVRINKLN